MRKGKPAQWAKPVRPAPKVIQVRSALKAQQVKKATPVNPERRDLLAPKAIPGQSDHRGPKALKVRKATPALLARKDLQGRAVNKAKPVNKAQLAQLAQRVLPVLRVHQVNPVRLAHRATRDLLVPLDLLNHPIPPDLKSSRASLLGLSKKSLTLKVA